MRIITLTRLATLRWLMRFVTMTEVIRHITKKMAQKMAWDIQSYWLKKGHKIDVWVERNTDGNAHDFMVRSNMMNGWPTKQ